jgi:hypothetical protein
MARRSKLTVLAASLALAVGMAGCSGGGSSGTSGGAGGSSADGTVSALTVADKVSVVDAKTESANTSGVVRALRLSGIQFPSDTDYSKDKTFTYVNDQSTDAFRTVNEILCMLSQARYDLMLNKGPYKALINSKLCGGSDSSSGASQQSAGSGATAPDYETWTLNATRTDNNTPQTVTAWVHEKSDGDEPEKVIHAKMTISESSSSTNPYGIFTLNFAAYPASGGVQTSNTMMFKGVLKAEKDAATGKVLLKFVNEQSDGTFKEKASLDKRTDGTGGGTVYQYDNSGGPVTENTLDFAYNSDLFRRSKPNASNEYVCLDRNNFETSAWRYGLYDSNGSRVNVNSGFPIKTTQNGKDYYGWIGYWGLWFPDSVSLANGDTVYKQTYGASGDTETPYTVLQSGGKLVKHTRQTTTLGSIKNIPLEGWMENGNSYRIEWNGTEFDKTAVMQNGNQDSPQTWQDITPASIDLNSLQMGELDLYSQSLGGQVRVKLDGYFDPNSSAFVLNSQPTDDTVVVYYKEQVVFPGDTIPTTFACFDNCPDASSLSTSNPYKASSGGFYNVAPSQAVSSAATYTFDSTNMVLKDGTSSLTTTATADQYQSGIMSGPLFDPAVQANLDALKCSWDQTGNSTCGWQAWSELSEFYTWETGPNNWNQFSALKDTQGTILKFEQPLQVQYVHAQTNSQKPDYKYNGVKFQLEYDGFGELNGIPGKCVDLNTGLPADCSQGGDTTRWVPEFTIPEGSTVTYNNSTTYYVKPLEVEQRMTKTTGCGSLLINTYTLPDISEWVDPNIGDEPALTTAPAIIAGVPQ